MRLKSLVCLTVLSIAAVASLSATAAPRTGSSQAYFDANGNLVGQSITWCEGNLSHAGNVHTPYWVFEEFDCTTNAARPSPPSYVPNDVGVQNYVLPASMTLMQACTLAQCFQFGPDEIKGTGWTYLPGGG